MTSWKWKAKSLRKIETRATHAQKRKKEKRKDAFRTNCAYCIIAVYSKVDIMAQAQAPAPAPAPEPTPAGKTSILENCDAYFDMVQSRKKLPLHLQQKLTEAFATIPVSSFPNVPGGKVIEISADTRVGDAVKILSEHNILSAPVTNPDAESSMEWRKRYLGIIDYSAIVLWVLEAAGLAAAALSASSAAAAGVGVGAAGTLGALALGATGPAAIAGLAVAAVGAAVAGGLAVDKGIATDGPTAANKLGEDFYKVILQEEPFKSTTVRSILNSYRWAPFLPVSSESPMLSVLLLLSKYRLRNVPVTESGKANIKNFITQSAVIQGLEQCKGRDWFDYISASPISELGLPFMSPDEIISIRSDEAILEAFIKMKENEIGGLPVVEGQGKKIIGNVSIRDIRFLLLRPDFFSNFRQLTVKDFIETIACTNLDSKKVIKPITCKPDSTLGALVHDLASNLVHRIYVVDGDDNQLRGVITLRDVISCFIYEPDNYFANNFGFAEQEMLDQGN